MVMVFGFLGSCDDRTLDHAPDPTAPGIVGGTTTAADTTTEKSTAPAAALMPPAPVGETSDASVNPSPPPPVEVAADAGVPSPCTDLTFGTKPVFMVSHVGERPAVDAPQGGALVDGIFDLSSWDDYKTIADETYDVPQFWSLKVSEDGKALEEINPAGGRRSALSVDGNFLSMSLRCGTSGSNPYVEGFTASSNRVVLTTPLWVLVFARRP